MPFSKAGRPPIRHVPRRSRSSWISGGSVSSASRPTATAATPVAPDLIPETQLRRARCLVAWWEGRDFVVENYATGRRATLSPPVVVLLSSLDQVESLDSLAARLAAVPDVASIVAQLVAADAVLVVGTELERRDAAI